MAVLPLSITAGVVFVSWPSYFLAYFLRDSEDGLKLADIICVIFCTTFIVVCIFMEKGSNIKRFKALFKGTSFMDLLALVLSFAVGIPLMWSAFSYKEGRWHDNTVIAVMNMSGEQQTVTLDLTGFEGSYKCLCGHKHQLEPAQSFTLEPWQFKIFER